MQRSLQALLDRVPGAREVLPHLAALETALGKRGPAVIASIAAPGLTKICSQLSSLPLPDDDPTLHDLLTRLMDALDQQRPPPPRFQSTVASHSGLVVSEASHSDFAAAAYAQATTVFGQL
jgi:hypothetical protein